MSTAKDTTHAVLWEYWSEGHCQSHWIKEIKCTGHIARSADNRWTTTWIKRRPWEVKKSVARLIRRRRDNINEFVRSAKEGTSWNERVEGFRWRDPNCKSKLNCCSQISSFSWIVSVETRNRWDGSQNRLARGWATSLVSQSYNSPKNDLHGRLATSHACGHKIGGAP